MIFAKPWFLLGALSALLLGAFLVVGALLERRSRRAFGDEGRIAALSTYDATKRRAYKGVFLVLATALAFVAAARPQYGKEKRLVPATLVDVILVLDFSKSMYARDVEPSRIDRAKSEVAELVRRLPGARFGAVAFAGESMGFPMTADGAAIAQFFRQLEPNDMPVGGTAIARALDQARELLRRDPKSKDHRRFVVLITDGEDLEGAPVSKAKQLGDAGTTVHVVQIGGRTPERIPDISEDGVVLGYRRSQDGTPLTTQLSPQAEAQLEAIAKATPGGKVVRSERGTTGILEIADDLGREMRSGALSEHYEDVYADVYDWPLGLAVLLLLLEAFLADAPRRRVSAQLSPAAAAALSRARRAGAAGLALVALSGCSGWDPRDPFARSAPEVDRAIELYEAGQVEVSEELLAAYLELARCKDDELKPSPALRERADAAFDLGLAYFGLAQRTGTPFGQEEKLEPAELERRAAWVRCAATVLGAVASDERGSAELRARARFLHGNLLVSVRDHKRALEQYDAALRLVPAIADGVAGDTIGRDVAYNRAIALRRLEEEQPPEPEPQPQPQPQPEPQPQPQQEPEPQEPEEPQPQEPQGQDPQPQEPQGQEPEPREPQGQEPQQGEPDDPPQEPPPSAGGEPPPAQPLPEPSPSAPPGPGSGGSDQRDRVLDQFEQAPSYQGEEARRRGQGRRRSMEDK